MTVPTVDNNGFDSALLDKTGALIDNRYAGLQLVGTSGGAASFYKQSGDINKRGTGGMPGIVNPRFLGKNGFYTNGPTFNPMAEAQARSNAVKAYTQSWSTPDKKDYLDRFSALLTTYGKTNSAGVLNGLAESGLDPATPAVQGVLKADAAANAANIGANKPAIATTAATDDEENWFQNLMQPVEAYSRIAFQYLNAPFQAVDALVRTTGGAVAAIVGDDAAKQRFNKSMMGGGPLAQIDIGQTIKSAFINPSTGEFDFDPWSAINQYQAGLDVNRAMEELRSDPAVTPMLNNPADSAKVMKLAEDMAKKNEWYTEPGWFVDETSQIGEAQRRATYDAWAIPGPNNSLTAWTLGRGVAGATVGPDSAAYGIMSGAIDAAWNIAADPLTYFGGAGLTAKGIAAASKLATNGENIIRVGRVAAKWRESISVANRINAKTQDEFNAFARDNGIKEVTPEQWAGIDAARQADIVKTTKTGNATQQALDGVGLNTDVIQNSIAGLRRSASIIDKVSGIPSNVEDVDSLVAGRSLVDNFNKYVSAYTKDGKTLVPYSKVEEWVAIQGPEALTQLNNYQSLEKAWAASQGIQMSAKEAAAGFSKYVDDVVAASDGRIGNANADRAIADAVQASIDNGIADIAQYGEDLPIGATLDDFIPGQPMQGVMNGSRVMAYAEDTAKFVVRSGDDFIDEATRSNLAGSLLKVLDDPRLNRAPIVAEPGDLGKLSGATADRINQSDNARNIIEELFADPSMTFGNALQTITRLGLDGYFDNFLRDNGIDGIGAGVQSGRKGTWFGEHPALEAYRVPEDLVDLSDQAIQSGDPAAFIASLAKGERADLHGMSPTDSLMYMMQQNKKYADIANDARLHDVTLLEKARLGQTKLDSAVKGIEDQFADPAEALKGVMSHEAGMRLLNGRGTLDAAGVRNFLFGYGPTSKMGKKSLEVLSSFISKEDIAKVMKEDGTLDAEAYKALESDWMGKLHDITSGKWTPDTYKKVIENAFYERGVDGLVDTLAPRLGIDVSQGSISKTIAALGTDGLRDFHSWNTMQPLVKRTAYQAMKIPDYLGRLRPNSRPVEIMNSTQIAERIRQYSDWAGLDENITNKLIGQVLQADSAPGAAGINRNALKDMFDALGDKLITELDDSRWFKNGRNDQRKQEMIAAIRENTKIYIGGKTGKGIEYGTYSADSVVDKVLLGTDGKVFKTPDFMIESEMATGVVNLPGVEDLMEASTRLGRALSALPKGTDGFGVAKRFYDNFFRTALLVGRGAYIIRNSAEMQVRMFLNGHQSIFNSPATLIGMSIGNTLARNLDPNSIFAKTLTPWRNTVLGTDFEVGTDAAQAALNHTEEFMAATRSTHAMTDQRLYNSGMRQGWETINVTAPRFNEGWAHELIMLHKSPIARFVLSGDPALYPGKANAEKQWDLLVDRFLSDDPEMFRIREILSSGDDQFHEIFADKIATRNYLFESEYSVLDRVKTFTFNDSGLQDFVRSGKYVAGDGVYNINEINELPKRVKDLSYMLQKQFRSDEGMDKQVVDWFTTKNVQVPWVKKGDGTEGNFLVNKFFDVSNKIERLGSLGPEFRMAYWDKIQELAPAINANEIDRAMEAARTTLGVIQRLSKNGILENIGKNHGVYAALKKVKQSGDNGNLSLDEVHDIAMKYAAEEATNLFYDAARRNDVWSSLRLIFPFGQAWGNTLKTWGELGKKNPIQVYKIMKVLNGAQQEDSSAMYEMLDSFGAYPDYAPGGAPYDQDASGGFFYQDQQGSTKFMLPFGGALASLPLKAWGAVSGVDTPSNIGVESPVQSLNFAVGADSILPGVSAFAASALNMFPDNQVVQQAKAAVAPFGSQSITEAAFAPWLQNMIAGAGSIPIVGGVLENSIGVLAPQKKNKYVADAMTFLSGTGKYDLTDPMQAQKLAEDSKSLGGALLLTGGLFQNLSPASPQFQVGFDAKKNLADMTQDTGHYAISMMNFMKQGYMSRNSNDSTEANLEMVQDFGPTALFALVGDWKGMERQPTSEALAFAYKNPEVAKAYNGQFQYFFPGGDSSDIQAREWAERNSTAEATRKSPKEIENEVISWMIRVQRARLNAFYQSGSINEEQYNASIAEVKDRYQGTMPATTIFSLDKTDEMNKFKYMYDETPQIQNSKAGLVFAQAWAYRDQALTHARSLTGKATTTLTGKKTAVIRESYFQDIDTLVAQHPEFKLLGLKFKKEFE
jgi:hypothetical protein